MKKWLARNSDLTSKDLLEKLNNPIDIDRLLESMNVRDAKEGVRKLFKILSKLTDYSFF